MGAAPLAQRQFKLPGGQGTAPFEVCKAVDEWLARWRVAEGLASLAHTVDGQAGKWPPARKRTGSCRVVPRCPSKGGR